MEGIFPNINEKQFSNFLDFYLEPEIHSKFSLTPVYPKKALPYVYNFHLKVLKIKLELSFLDGNPEFEKEMKEIKMIDQINKPIISLANYSSNEEFINRMKSTLNYYYEENYNEVQTKKNFNSKTIISFQKNINTPEIIQKKTENNIRYEENHKKKKNDKIEKLMMETLNIDIKEALGKDANEELFQKYQIQESDLPNGLKTDEKNVVALCYEFFQRAHKLKPVFNFSEIKLGLFKCVFVLERAEILQTQCPNKKLGKLKLAELSLKIFCPCLIGENNKKRKNTENLEEEQIIKKFKNNGNIVINKEIEKSDENLQILKNLEKTTEISEIKAINQIANNQNSEILTDKINNDKLSENNERKNSLENIPKPLDFGTFEEELDLNFDNFTDLHELVDFPEEQSPPIILKKPEDKPQNFYQPFENKKPAIYTTNFMVNFPINTMNSSNYQNYPIQNTGFSNQNQGFNNQSIYHIQNPILNSNNNNRFQNKKEIFSNDQKFKQPNNEINKNSNRNNNSNNTIIIPNNNSINNINMNSSSLKIKNNQISNSNKKDNFHKSTDIYAENNKEEEIYQFLSKKNYLISELSEEIMKISKLQFNEAVLKALEILRLALNLYNKTRSDCIALFTIKTNGQSRVSLKNSTKTEIATSTNINQRLAEYFCLIQFFKRNFKEFKYINEIFNVLAPKKTDKIIYTQKPTPEITNLMDEIDQFQYTGDILNNEKKGDNDKTNNQEDSKDNSPSYHIKKKNNIKNNDFSQENQNQNFLINSEREKNFNNDQRKSSSYCRKRSKSKSQNKNEKNKNHKKYKEKDYKERDRNRDRNHKKKHKYDKPYYNNEKKYKRKDQERREFTNRNRSYSNSSSSSNYDGEKNKKISETDIIFIE